MLNTIKNLLNEEDGVTSVEYAVVAAGIVAIVSTIFAKEGAVSKMLSGVFETVKTQVDAIMGVTPAPKPPF